MSRSVYTRLITAFILAVLIIVLWVHRTDFIPDSLGLFGRIAGDVLCFALTLFFIILYYLFALNGKYVLYYHECFDRIGFLNSIGRTPFLLRRRNSNDRIHLSFLSFGIPLDKWESEKENLENALNISISSISCGTSHRMVRLDGICGRYDWTKPLVWNDDFLDSTDKLLLGLSMSSKVSFSLSAYPHILLGGATGSGKTYLLKLLLYQCIKKHYSVYIADLKGGLDYPECWQNECTMAFEELDILALLNGLENALQTRLEILANSHCKDISQYNTKTNSNLPRIIFACDEIAELLDERGRTKEEKLIVQEISARIRTFARLGRAAGIHLFLATQRADADVISGQIKSNITYRACGTADNMLSVITLDNGDAATMVPKDIPGVFLNQEGTLFKSYLITDSGLV